MPLDPMNPQPPITQPGMNRPDSEIRQPGNDWGVRDADPQPLEDDAIDEQIRPSKTKP